MVSTCKYVPLGTFYCWYWHVSNTWPSTGKHFTNHFSGPDRAIGPCMLVCVDCMSIYVTVNNFELIDFWSRYLTDLVLKVVWKSRGSLSPLTPSPLFPPSVYHPIRPWAESWGGSAKSLGLSPPEPPYIKPWTHRFTLTLYRDNSKVKVIGEGRGHRRKNAAKVVGATSSEGFSSYVSCDFCHLYFWFSLWWPAKYVSMFTVAYLDT